MARVTIIGAGSVEFTRNVVADLCSYEELHGSVTFALHDIDENRLAYAYRAAESIVELFEIETHVTVVELAGDVGFDLITRVRGEPGGCQDRPLLLQRRCER